MSKMLRSLYTLIIACLLLCLTLPVLAAGTDTFTVPEVTVGISEYPGYASLDDSGNLTGADVEYAYRIAQYANLRFKIVLINDAEDYFGALDSGRVDMLFEIGRAHV